MAANPEINVRLEILHNTIKTLDYKAVRELLTQPEYYKLINTPNENGDAALIVAFKTIIPNAFEKPEVIADKRINQIVEASSKFRVTDQNPNPVEKKSDAEQCELISYPQAKYNTIIELLRGGADVNQRGGAGSKNGTVLHIAVHNAVTAVDDYEFEALKALFDDGNQAFDVHNPEAGSCSVQKLLDSNLFNSEGHTPLTIALMHYKDNTEFSVEINNQGKWYRETPWFRKLISKTDLTNPAGNYVFLASAKILEFMLCFGIDIKCLDYVNSSGQTALGQAIRLGDKQKLTLLLNAGATQLGTEPKQTDSKSCDEKLRAETLKQIELRQRLSSCLSPEYLRAIANYFESQYLCSRNSTVMDYYHNDKNVVSKDYLLLQREEVMRVIKQENFNKFLVQLVIRCAPEIYKKTESEIAKFLTSTARETFMNQIKRHAAHLEPMMKFALYRQLSPRDPAECFLPMTVNSQDAIRCAIAKTAFSEAIFNFIPPPLKNLIFEYMSERQDQLPHFTQAKGFAFAEWNCDQFLERNVQELNTSLFSNRCLAFERHKNAQNPQEYFLSFKYMCVKHLKAAGKTECHHTRKDHEKYKKPPKS